MLKYSTFGFIIGLVSWQTQSSQYYKETKIFWIEIIALILALLLNLFYPGSWLLIYSLLGLLFIVFMSFFCS